MSLLPLLILLVIAGICGSIAELIVGFSPGGFLVSIVVGVIGAYIGSYIAQKVQLGSPLVLKVGTQSFDLVWATIGSIVLLAVITLLRGNPSRRFGFSRRRR